MVELILVDSGNATSGEYYHNLTESVLRKFSETLTQLLLDTITGVHSKVV